MRVQALIGNTSKKNIPKHNQELNGRGLAIIQECVFQQVEYQGCGNEVICVIKLT